MDVWYGDRSWDADYTAVDHAADTFLMIIDCGGYTMYARYSSKS